jgi:hypothetical protein
MRRATLLFLVVACDAGRSGSALTKQVGSLPACATTAEVTAKQRAIDADDKRSYEAAVAAQKLSVLALPRIEEVIGDGLRQDQLSHQNKLEPIKRADSTFVEGITYWSQNGNPGEDPDFVVDANQRVFAVERIRTAAADVITRCGCQPFNCGSPCPACGDTRRVLYGPLPRGTSFSGTVKIDYPGRALTTPYANGACPPEPCPP